MPLQATSGAASYDGFGGGVAVVANYIEDVFSTWLYTGNNSTQTITNGIDLAGKGGLVWVKRRSSAQYHALNDTARGAGNVLQSSATDSNIYQGSDGLSAFTSSGFSIGFDSGYNTNAATYASWTFRKQAKFFDVVTWTGDGNTSKTIPHNLGSVPGCIITKMSSGVNNWQTYHRSLGNTQAVQLNLTNAASTNSGFWNNTSPTATEFTVGTVENAEFETYVAYLFAHDAGGFGLTGTDNVISCGSFTVSGNAATVNLGYEPQWLLIKSANSVSAWDLFDSMRGLQVSGNQPVLNANNSGAEFGTGSGVGVNVTSTGFATNGYLGNGDHIYIAIRRGPMKTPTTGTSVYEGTTRNGTGAAASISGLAFPPDAVLTRNRDSNSSSRYAWYDKLRGATRYLDTAATDAEFTVAQSLTSFNQTGESFGTGVISNANGEPYINWQFRRAPGFFDVVCYTGSGNSPRNISHNLNAIPELLIVKNRTYSPSRWTTYVGSLGPSKHIYLELTNAAATNTSFPWQNTAPTASVFTVDADTYTNAVGYNYVAYLFASCPGVSKVGSYTGTGTTLQIDCGFTGGARFVLIKRTDSAGDWYCWDSSRGIVSGNDPYLLLNSNAAEVTNTDYIDTYSAGFEISSTAPAAINANGGSFVFLAIS